MLKEDLITILILGGAIAAWMLLIAFFAEREKRSQKNGRYDERQLAARGRAFQWGFFTMVVYYLVYGFVTDCFGIVWCDRLFGTLLGIQLGTLVFCVICIFSDAYLRPADSRTGALIGINCIGASQLFIYLSHYRSEPPVRNGVVTETCVYLLFIALALMIDLAFFVKWRSEKREEQHEKPET